MFQSRKNPSSCCEILLIHLIVSTFFLEDVTSTLVLEIDFIKNGTGSASKLNEAEAIALDTTGNFLPVPSLVSKISKDLATIRDQFPDMKNITYTGTFIPGQLIVSQIKQQQLKDIDTSEFGPLASIYKLRRGGFALLEFKMPYNPYQLGEIVKVRFGVDNSPVLLPSFGSSIIYEPGSFSKYTFRSGFGNFFVKNGCSKWNSWAYSVSDNGTVSIVLDLHPMN